jgi:hypothetical protein
MGDPPRNHPLTALCASRPPHSSLPRGLTFHVDMDTGDPIWPALQVITLPEAALVARMPGRYGTSLLARLSAASM